MKVISNPMILYEARLGYLMNDPSYEQDVRSRMQREGINTDEYPYLVPKPYPEPECMRSWFSHQFENSTDSYKFWKGWIMLQHESDALLVFMTWRT